jgi:CheY-like chemotaxis protein
MKSLLIYNDNIAPQLVIDFERELGSTYKYQVDKQELLSSYFTIDKKIDGILKTVIDKCKYDCIFIPYSLSEENYIEFTGLRFACHIRLTPEFNNLQTPIVFFGYETENEVNKLSELGTILFSSGIYTTDKISVQNFEKQLNYVKNMGSEISDELFLKQFTNRVNISPSGNYATHHSITNEWSIYRWAKALKIDDEQIRKIEKNIGSNIYFKYLKAQFPIKESIDANNSIIREEGIILHIDDEVEKGWDIIFRKIYTRERYKPIGNDFKNLDSSRIVESAITKVNYFNPDVVILDFRLHDDDFENITPDKVTGYRILREIKEINKGIQVIIFTASNKIWNYQTLSIIGFDGWIIKESPELSTNSEYTIKAIQALNEQIDKGVERAKFLKVIYSKIKKLEELIKSNKFFDSTDDTLRNKFLSNFEISFDLLYKATQSKEFSKYYSYAYLQLFLCVEEFLEIKVVFEKGDKCYVNKNIKVAEKINDKKYKSIIRFNETDKSNNTPSFWDYFENESEKINPYSTDFKMSAVLIFLFGQENSNKLNWPEIRNVRNNKAAHPVKGNITQSNINEVLKFLEFIFDKQNIDISKKKGLSDEISDDDINRLKEIFGGKI